MTKSSLPYARTNFIPYLSHFMLKIDNSSKKHIQIDKFYHKHRHIQSLSYRSSKRHFRFINNMLHKREKEKEPHGEILPNGHIGKLLSSCPASYSLTASSLYSILYFSITISPKVFLSLTFGDQFNDCLFAFHAMFMSVIGSTELSLLY